MGINILVGYDEGRKDEELYQSAIMYCNTADWAFGPVFTASEDESINAEEMARGFLNWHDKKFGDPRGVPDSVLENRYMMYRRANE